MEKDLLFSVIRASWLRIIIVGQRVPAKHGESWEDSSNLIELQPPTPQEWFEFGKQYKPGITLDFVLQAYEYIDGKSSYLAGLLGPKR